MTILFHDISEAVQALLPGRDNEDPAPRLTNACLESVRTPVSMEYLWDVSASNKGAAELTFANTLVIADEARLDVQFCKYLPNRLARLVCYTHHDWLDLYRQFCDPLNPVGRVMEGWSRHVVRLAEIYARKVCLRVPKHLRWLCGALGSYE